MKNSKALPQPTFVSVPLVISLYIGLTLVIGVIAAVTLQGFGVAVVGVLNGLVISSALLAIPIVLHNSSSHHRVLLAEQNELLRENARDPSADLWQAEAQMAAAYIAGVDAIARLERDQPDSAARQQAIADLQSALQRIQPQLEPLSVHAEHERQIAQTESLRQRLLAAIEFVREQLKPYPPHTLGQLKSHWESSRKTCQHVAQRLSALIQSNAWDEERKTRFGFDQLETLQQQFTQLSQWPQPPAPGVVPDTAPPPGTGIYEYTQTWKAAEKSLNQWQRKLERASDTET